MNAINWWTILTYLVSAYIDLTFKYLETATESAKSILLYNCMNDGNIIYVKYLMEQW